MPGSGEPAILEIAQKQIKPRKGLDLRAKARSELLADCLPAGLDQTRYVTAHGRFTQHVTGQAELTVHTVRTAGQTAAIAQASSAGVARLLLQGYLGFPTRFRSGVRVGDDSFQLGTLLGVLGNRLLTLQLTV